MIYALAAGIKYGVDLIAISAGAGSGRSMRLRALSRRPVNRASLAPPLTTVRYEANSRGEIMSEIELFPPLWLGDPNKPKETWLRVRCSRSSQSTEWPFTLELGKWAWPFDLAIAKDIGDAIWTIDYRRGLMRLSRVNIRLGPVFRCTLDFGDGIKNVIEFGLCDANGEAVAHFYFVFGEHRYQGPLDEADHLINALRTFGRAANDISNTNKSAAPASPVV
jgi:hypothetical protein